MCSTIRQWQNSLRYSLPPRRGQTTYILGRNVGQKDNTGKVISCSILYSEGTMLTNELFGLV